MADEFAKGFGILITAGLGWLITAGWYNTAGYEATQLVAPDPKNVDIYGKLALMLGDALFWFAIVGTLTFWIVIPALNEARETWSDRQS